MLQEEVLREETLAERVKAGREERGLTQSELADRAKVSRATIARIESGAGGSVSFSAVMRVLHETNWELLLEKGVSPHSAATDAFNMDAYLDSLFGGER